MRLQDLNWMDVEAYLEHDNRIILVVGATAQHAYLSLLTAALIPSNIALAAAELAHVLVAPALNFGVSDNFAEFPGTISLSPLTFDAVVFEIIMSLMHQGFGGFFVVNGFAGNKIPARVSDLHLEGAARVNWYDWWRSPVVRAFEEEIGLKLDHANWGENFPFNRVAVSPGGEKRPVNLAYSDEGAAMRDLLGDGSFGGAYQVDDALMDNLFARVVDDVVALLDEL